MSTLTCNATSVKSYEAELAVLDAELEAAHLADDSSRWLAAWNAREELQIARFLAEYPPCPDDEPDPSEPEPVDWPSELDQFYNSWYALGYDCATTKPPDDLDAFRLWIARIAYDRGWKKGREDRYTWLDELEWDHLEVDEAEIRGMIVGHPAWDWDADDDEHSRHRGGHAR